MVCSACGYENQAGMHFCGMCGTPLPHPQNVTVPRPHQQQEWPFILATQPTQALAPWLKQYSDVRKLAVAKLGGFKISPSLGLVIQYIERCLRLRHAHTRF